MLINKIRGFIISLIVFSFCSFMVSASDFKENGRPTEYKIPTKILANGNDWEDEILIQENGTCVSHAVSDCLMYIHGQDDIMPSYLHKVAHYWRGNQDYTKGHGSHYLMNFVRDYGVPEMTSENEESGSPFPFGTKKYSFDKIYNIDSDVQGPTRAEKIKNALLKYKAPIVIGVTAIIDGHDVFSKYTHKIGGRLRNDNPPFLSEFSGLIEGHSVTVYGYSDQENGFLIKNNWGKEWCSNGKAILNYDYYNKYGGSSSYVRSGNLFGGERLGNSCYIGNGFFDKNGRLDAYVGLGEKYIHDDYVYPCGYGFKNPRKDTNTTLYLQGLGAGLLTVFSEWSIIGMPPTTMGSIILGITSLATGLWAAAGYWDGIIFADSQPDDFPVQ